VAAGGAAARAVAVVALLAVGGCVSPALTRDGQLVFTPGATSGAVVITANGVEIIDRGEQPQPQVRTSPYEPFQPPAGFLLPASGRFTHVAEPVTLSDDALSFVLRPGESLVPSWGGEMLLQVDVKAAGGERRAAMSVVLVLDGDDAELTPLACRAAAGLLATDRAAVIDSRGPRALLPTVSASQQSLLEGAIHRRRPAPPGARDLPGALALAQALLAGGGTPAGAEGRVLVLTDGDGLEQAADGLRAAVASLERSGARVEAAGPSERLAPGALSVFETQPEQSGTFARRQAVAAALPQARGPGPREVTLSLSSSPSPARVIEGSGGQHASVLEEDLLFLGDLSAGQGRSEVLRVALPPFVAGEGFRLSVRVRYASAPDGEERSLAAVLAFRYTGDPTELAAYRAADVIGQAAALSLVGKLDRALLGGAAARPEGMRGLLDFERRSLLLLGAERRAPALADEAELLRALGWAIEGG
jgi:hypothetical protein